MSDVTKPEVIKPKLHVQHVTLPCGCTYEAVHSDGDRAVICNCDRKWVVNASRASRIDYSTREVPNERF